MKEIINKIKAVGADLWNRATVEQPPAPRLDINGELLPPPSPAQARIDFRYALTSYVADGWSIEIENEFDAVLSRKPKFRWVGKLIIFLILIFIWAPIALFYLIVVIVRGVTAKPSRKRLWVTEDGRIEQG